MTPRPILLAAGRSSRFEDGHKLLAPLLGAPVVAHALGALIGAGLGRPLVVLGARGDAVREALDAAFAPDAFETLVNPRPAEGMGTSLALAARASLGTPILLALGDMPCLTASDHRAVAAALDPSDPLAVARGGAVGKAGHPVAFGPGWAERLAALQGDAGAASLLRGRPVALVPLEPASQIDVDTRAALSRAGRVVAARPNPLAIPARPL